MDYGFDLHEREGVREGEYVLGYEWRGEHVRDAEAGPTQRARHLQFHPFLAQSKVRNGREHDVLQQTVGMDPVPTAVKLRREAIMIRRRIAEADGAGHEGKDSVWWLFQRKKPA